MPRDVIQIRADEELRGLIDSLAADWGGIRPLPTSQVIREALRRARRREPVKPPPRARPAGRPGKAGAG